MLARDNNNNIIIVRHLMNLLDDNFITIKETELIFPTYNLRSKRIFLLESIEKTRMDLNRPMRYNLSCAICKMSDKFISLFGHLRISYR
jgi:hypothetical protein